jgi:hypothetical protein
MEGRKERRRPFESWMEVDKRNMTRRKLQGEDILNRGE